MGFFKDTLKLGKVGEILDKIAPYTGVIPATVTTIVKTKEKEEKTKVSAPVTFAESFEKFQEFKELTKKMVTDPKEFLEQQRASADLSTSKQAVSEYPSIMQASIISENMITKIFNFFKENIWMTVILIVVVVYMLFVKKK